MAVALAAFDASVVVLTEDGEQQVPLADLYRSPGEQPQRDTNLPGGALIIGVELPALPMAVNSSYRKVRDRASYAFAVASVGAVLVVTDGQIADIRIGLGAVAHKPWRARTAEAQLVGVQPTRAAFTAAIAAELEAAEPLEDNAFKVPLVTNLVATTLVELTAAGTGAQL